MRVILKQHIVPVGCRINIWITIIDGILNYRDFESEDNYFFKEDLTPYKLLEKIDISSDVKSVSLCIQFLRHVTVDSKIFNVNSEIFSDDKAVVKKVVFKISIIPVKG